MVKKMSDERFNLKYPPRAYKKVHELVMKENAGIRFAELQSFMEVDERVHAPSDSSEVARFYKGKSVFITGGSGFVGKLLLEKLLRSCKDIKNVYLLIRPKRGKDVATRIREILDDLVFSQLRQAQPYFKIKIIPIMGDISLPCLGINLEDQQILKNEINVMFHVGATIKFEEKLDVAARINIGGTNELLKLARKCKNLTSIVYVSTAYSNFPHEKIEEKFYEPPYMIEEMIKFIETGENLDGRTKSILGKWPNTYTFTKAVAEHIVKAFGDELPVCIFRPAVITSTYKEPLNRWIDNYYGGVGVITSHYGGVLRSFQSDPGKVVDAVPADFVVNCMIVAAYSNQYSDGTIKIYNYTSSPQNPIKFGDFHDLANYYGHQTPTLKSIWYPNNKLRKNFYVHKICTFFLHIIPAILIDTFLVICGRKTKMLSLYNVIHKFNNTSACFTTQEWTFRNDNVQKLWNGLSDTDKKLFSFSMAKTKFNWNEYLSTICAGIRIYMFKDDLSTIPEALRMQKRLFYYHRCCQFIFTTVVLLLVLSVLNYFFMPLCT